MTLLLDKKYEPDYREYRGRAYRAEVEFTTLRTGLPPLDDLLSWLAEEVVEAAVTLRGGRMLWLRIWRDPSEWWLIPTWTWRVEWYFYITPETEARVGPAAIPAVVWTIAKLIAAAVLVIAIAVAIKNVSELVWGPPGAPAWLIPTAILVAAVGFAVPAIAGVFKRSVGV